MFNGHVLEVDGGGNMLYKNSDNMTCTQFLDKPHF